MDADEKMNVVFHATGGKHVARIRAGLNDARKVFVQLLPEGIVQKVIAALWREHEMENDG